MGRKTLIYGCLLILFFLCFGLLLTMNGLSEIYGPLVKPVISYNKQWELSVMGYDFSVKTIPILEGFFKIVRK